jgi:hypothetical protein
MAEAKKAKAAPAGGKSKKKGGKLGLYIGLTVAGVAAFTMFPTVVLVMIGLIPTMVAFFVDKDREHSGAVAVGAMNCAGLTPFVIDLLIKGQSMANTFQILANPNSWLVILGASAIGQVIVSIVPQAMATLALAHSETRIKNLRNNIELLKTSWGPDVGTTKPVEQLVRGE